MASDPNFNWKIILTEEVHFWMNGYVNKVVELVKKSIHSSAKSIQYILKVPVFDMNFRLMESSVNISLWSTLVGPLLSIMNTTTRGLRTSIGLNWIITCGCNRKAQLAIQLIPCSVGWGHSHLMEVMWTGHVHNFSWGVF